MNTIENKYSETGSNPYYLNQNNTAKNYSFNNSTNPQIGLLETLSQFVIVENPIEISPFYIDDIK